MKNHKTHISSLGCSFSHRSDGYANCCPHGHYLDSRKPNIMTYKCGQVKHHQSQPCELYCFPVTIVSLMEFFTASDVPQNEISCSIIWST